MNEFTFLSQSFKKVNLGEEMEKDSVYKFLALHTDDAYFPTHGRSLRAELLNWEQQGVCAQTHTGRERETCLLFETISSKTGYLG